MGKFSLPSVQELHEEISNLKSQILALFPSDEQDELISTYPFLLSTSLTSTSTSSSTNTKNSTSSFLPSDSFLLEFNNIVGDTTQLHLEISNQDSIFQCASQFNCLEMANPWIVPEEGITCYEGDKTQGPLSAMCCPYGTFIRNYYALDGSGQSTSNQINTLKDIETSIENDKYHYWIIRNGYFLHEKIVSKKSMRS